MTVPHSVQAEGGPVIVSVSPEEDGEITNTTPVITVIYYSDGEVDLASVSMEVDGQSIMEFDELWTANSTTFTYEVPGLLELELGNHTVLFAIADDDGTVTSVTWNFTVVEPSVASSSGIDVRTLLIDAAVVITVASVGGAGYYMYLRRYKRFTFRKYFLRNPVKKVNLVIFIPVAAAVLFALVAMLYFSGLEDNDPFMYEYIVVGALFIGLFPYALYNQMNGKTRMKYEMAFAQFLFELAD